MKPSMGPEFILNALSSLGRFFTEHKLLLNGTLIVCFHNAKLIAEEDDSESLQNYSNQVMNIFVNNQLVFFPKGQRMIDAFIIQAGDLLDRVIINNKSNIYEMPAVQLSDLLLEHDELFEQFKNH